MYRLQNEIPKIKMIFFQLESLEEVFKESRYPDVYRREEIAASLDLKEEVVRVSVLHYLSALIHFFYFSLIWASIFSMPKAVDPFERYGVA